MTMVFSTTSSYDWVQSGSTQNRMNPDKTEANLHRAESRSRREEHHDGAEKLTQVRGGRGRRHIRRRASGSY